MADNDAELTLRLNVQEAEEDAKKIPEILQDAFKKIEGKGLTNLEKRITEAVKSSEKLADSFSNAYTELEKIDRGSRELKNLQDLKAPLEAEIKAQQSAFNSAQNKFYTKWKFEDPSSAGYKQNEEDRTRLSAALKENEALLADLNREQATLTANIETSRLAVESVMSSYREQDATVQQIVADVSTETAALEQQAQAHSGLVSDTKEEALNTQNVKENLGSAASSSGELARDIKDISGSSGTNPLNELAQSASELDGLGDRINSALNFDRSSASFAELLRHSEELKLIYKELEKNHWPSQFSNEIEQVRAEMIQTKQAISDYEQSFKRTSSTMDTVATNMKKVSSVANKVVSGIRQGFRTVVSAANAVLSAVRGIVNIFKTGFTTAGKAIGKVTSAFDRLTSSSRSNFKHLITNITKYVLGFRSLFFLVRRLRKYIGEGIKNMAQFNDGNNHVNASITRLLSSLLYLKNAWATAFSPILQFVTPWLEALIDKLAEAGNAFSRFLGSLLGQTQVFQAVKVKASDYAEGLDKAGGSAGKAAKNTKKLTDRLAAFDDLNVLGKDNDPNKNGTGGGGGGSYAYSPDPNSMFKLVNVGKEALDKLKSMWDNADFSDLGKTISNKIVSGLRSIDWNKIQTNAYKIGKSIATFLSGALKDKSLFNEVGTSMSEAVNTLTSLISGYLTGDDVDWGGGFASLINKFFENTNWGDIKNNIKLFTDKLVENVNSFLSGLDESKIGEGASSLSEGLTYFIANALSGIHWGELLPIFQSVGMAIVDGLSSGLSGTDNPLLQAVGNLIGSFKTAIDTQDPKAAADGLTNFLKSVCSNINIDDVLGVLKEFFGRMFSNLFSSISIDPDSVIGEFLTSLKMVADTLLNVFSMVMGILPKLLPGILLITQASMDFINALLPIVETLLPPLNDLVAQVTAIISALLVPALQLLTPVISLIAGILNLIMPIFEMIVEFIQETTGSTSDLLGPLMELVQAILEPLGAILRPLMQIIKIILDLVADLLAPIMDLIGPLIEILVECFRPISGILEVIGEFIGTLIVPLFKLLADVIRVTVIPILKALVGAFEFVQSIMNTLGTSVTALVTFFKLGFEEIKKGVVTASNFIAGTIEWVINAIIKGINSAIRTLNKLSFDIPDWVPELGGKKFGFNMKELSKVSIPRLAQGAVIPPNNEFMAVLGDQSHGTNVEAPLDTIKQAVAEVMGNGGNAEVIQLLQELIEVVRNKNLNIGDKQIAQANSRYQKQQQIINGSTF